MTGPIIALVTLALTLAWALFLRAGVKPSDWASAVLFTGAICAGYWMFVRRREVAPPVSSWLRRALWALGLYTIFQLVPLPLGFLHLLSPARASLAQALAPVVPGVSSAPLSVSPPMALFWAVSLLCYIAVFFLLRELSWRFVDRPWFVLLPVMVLATLEAATAIFQAWKGSPVGDVRGTYTNRDHFCVFLEMAIPFCLVFGWNLLLQRRESDKPTFAPIAGAMVSWAAGAAMFFAVLESQSRIGVFVAMCSMFVVVALCLGPRLPSKNFRMISLTIFAVIILSVFVLLPPDQLLERLADMSASGKVTASTRIEFWKQTLSLIGEFPLFGCGLGGFESTFLKYQNAANAYRVEMAHNDYLQYLAELGIIGFTLALAVAAGILIPVGKAVLGMQDESRRLLLVACAGSFVVIALHSFVDFNLYIPATVMTLAWITGVASMNAQE